jgi:hypothetical protein
MARELLVGVRGESFANEDGSSRQEIIRRLRPGMAMTLVADPLNPFDSHAVRVLTGEGQQVGFLPSDARDFDAVVKGEPISAIVHAVTGGTSWLRRLMGKRSVGLVLRIRKGDPDWARRAALEALAAPVDAQVQAALALEKSAPAEPAIEAMQAAVAAVRALTAADRFASAHRRMPAPVERLSLLLERSKRYAEAVSVIEEWQRAYDPVQPGVKARETLMKRAERLRGKS